MTEGEGRKEGEWRREGGREGDTMYVTILA